VAEPDYRFTLANERTYLAWLRTALALLGGAVAISQLIDRSGLAWLRIGLGVALVLLGLVVSVMSVWRWHAAEENEHKAVAFDVFKAAGGSYPERALAMIGATVIFWAKVIEQQYRMMKVDGTHHSLSEWVKLGKFMFVEPGGFLRLIPTYFSYFRPGFHPWDHDNTKLLEDWKLEIANAPEYRRVA